MAGRTPGHEGYLAGLRMAGGRGRLVALLALAALVALFFQRLLFSGLILARGDVLLYFYPYWQAVADALLAGRLPLWNPYLFTGAPLLANSQAGVLYPLNWPLWLALPVPYAASASIALHILIAAMGAYYSGRRWLGLSMMGALLAAVLFGLGGYVTAQVEHINQFQGLAWLPWILAMAGRTAKEEKAAATVWHASLLGALLALQILAGHTQTSFITISAALVVAVVHSVPARRGGGSRAWLRAGRGLRPLLLGGVLALLIAAAQLLPTFELAQHSSRQGGLPAREALSFSLHPLLLARALLPGLGEMLYTEYVAWLPVTAWLLALLAAARWRERRELAAAAALALVGLLFALGLFSPVYQVLVRLPGFDLFRAPARWLALTSLGAALLAGAGWDTLWSTAAPLVPRQLRVAIMALLGLIAWGLASGWLARLTPGPPEQPLGPPAAASVLLWLGELALAALLLAYARRRPAARALWLLLPIALGVLYAATRVLPYNHPTAPQAYFDLRPPVARLLAATRCLGSDPTCRPAPGRLLSLSDILFDVGDQAELDTIYADLLPEQERYDYAIAVKHQEVIGPNLPLAYKLASVDGFDGGILPLKAYTQLMGLLTEEGEVPADGRLREYLEEVPAARWLNLLNVRYVITDKVGDTWREGAFFDQQHPLALNPGDAAAEVGFVPAYEATALRLIASGPPGTVHLETAAGDRWALEPSSAGDGRLVVPFPAPAVLTGVALEACGTCAEPWRVAALTLVDRRDGSFQPLVPGSFRLIHSGDVKIYENLDVLPRAFIVSRWEVVASTADALATMAGGAFDPRETAVLIGDGPEPVASQGGEATIVADAAEQVTIQVDSNSGGLLVLTDADYPGWRADVDGVAATIYRANVLCRGVWVPAGAHEVTFRYEPNWLSAGFALSLLGVALAAGGLLAGRRLAGRRPHQVDN